MIASTGLVFTELTKNKKKQEMKREIQILSNIQCFDLITSIKRIQTITNETRRIQFIKDKVLLLQQQIPEQSLSNNV